jgi:hypothetical protein
MGLFSRKSSGGDVKEFAKTLADKLSKRYPPAIDNNPEKRVSENRLSRVLEETLAQATDFQKEHKLGVLGKAKLANEFRWQLKELGYSKQFIEIAAEGMMVYITRGSDSKATA